MDHLTSPKLTHGVHCLNIRHKGMFASPPAPIPTSSRSTTGTTRRRTGARKRSAGSAPTARRCGPIAARESATVVNTDGRAHFMIRECAASDFEQIWQIINDGAQAYKGIIPADRWTEPYMSREKLRHEIDDGVEFQGYEEHGGSPGSWACSSPGRHPHSACVRAHQQPSARYRRGAALASAGEDRSSRADRQWADAVWAIRFYEKHGYRVVDPAEKDRLLRKYWNVPDRQVETSVVLVESSPIGPGRPPRPL